MARGDQVEVLRKLGFSHHGIDIGDGTIVHFTGEPKRKLQAEVLRTSWQEFTRGDPFRVIEHAGWTWTPDHTCLRALMRVRDTGYDLVRSNCEHFATFCKTGRSRSPQIEQSATRIVRYSRFGVFHPGYLLAGPAMELSQRGLSASARTIKKVLGLEQAPTSPAVQRDSPVSFFHYVDMYAPARQGDVIAYHVTPYGQWFPVKPDGSCQQPVGAVSSARYNGRWLVDENLMPYWLRPDGNLSRQAPGDDEVLYVGTQYSVGETSYWLTAAGDCSQMGDNSEKRVPRIPENATPLAMLFRDRRGVNHAVTQKGWFVFHDNNPVAEPAFRAHLGLI